MDDRWRTADDRRRTDGQRPTSGGRRATGRRAGADVVAQGAKVRDAADAQQVEAMRHVVVLAYLAGVRPRWGVRKRGRGHQHAAERCSIATTAKGL